MSKDKIIIRGARVNNLKNISLEIPKNKLVVVTGLSGSGKSSLVYDTIYAEGQRRYSESLSSYARQFLGTHDRPDVDQIEGLSPTIAIEQRTGALNPRSTVGTMTEIYDYLRLLFARIGRSHCPNDGEELRKLGVEQIAQKVLNLLEKNGLVLLARLAPKDIKEPQKIIRKIQKAGISEIRLNKKFFNIEDIGENELDILGKYPVEAVIAKLNKKNFSAKNVLPEKDGNTLLAGIKKALDWGRGTLIVCSQNCSEQGGNDEILFSERLACPKCHYHLPSLEPGLFSFNIPSGACPDCTGLGVKLVVEPRLVIPNPRLTLAQGAVKPWTRIAGSGVWYQKLLSAVSKANNFSLHEPVKNLPQTVMKKILYGTGGRVYEIEGKKVAFPGIIAELSQKYKETKSDYVRKEIENYMETSVCPSCQGKRLKPEALLVTLDGKSIADLVNLSVEECFKFFSHILNRGSRSRQDSSANSVPRSRDNKSKTLTADLQAIAPPVIKEINLRLANLMDVGLGYLSLDRPVTTLSGGEMQRARLSTQISTSLTGVIYILDEPSTGLHARDVAKLISTLKSLRGLGNAVLVVEHDAATIMAADHIIDIGPGAGEHGGTIIAQGPYVKIKKQKNSLTGQYLAGKLKIDIPKSQRKGPKRYITIKGAREFNLKNIDASIPLSEFVCVTGVSGSGKSTLIIEILGKSLSHKLHRAKSSPGRHRSIQGINYIDKVVTIDQSPIGKSPRSNPATYTGIFTTIRELFAGTPEAVIRGFDTGKFSFNVKDGGRCETCVGEGYVRIEMRFLPDVFIECKDCHGKRYNREALEIRWEGKTIADILNMTVEEARRFFASQSKIPLIYDKLSLLFDVGLGYVRLGQPSNKLSGGEAQRIKLAAELSRRETGKTLYILDEPTTGLHFDDIKRLLMVLNQLVKKGNTVVVIEHNMDVIKSADWIIDMGPEGGDRGGKIVVSGTPEKVAKCKSSYTGQELKKALH